ncbi:MAG TPA: phosphonate ABC transporter ATP-binding protein [Microvirga sp.]|jgi:phosphonate transport system ATP-binding protein|nr:phosphonate ABC transporter ATP-binding protein [Microvirga sp.]
MLAIGVENVSKTFRGDKRALSDVSLQVQPGEFVALIGASGSGKSTLIRHITGLVTADATGSGTIRVFGEPVQERGRLSRGARAIRRDIGVVFQQFNLVSRLSVLTNVLTGILGRIPTWRGTLGLFTRAEKQQALQALRRVGIAETAGQRASTLSGGQQQRAAIARALVQGARVILADEPIASLDPASAKRVMDTLADINRREGITILVSLHQVEYARRYCPRTIALRNGTVAYDGPSEALTTAFLRDLYGEASEELFLPEIPAPAPSPAARPAGRPALVGA